MDQYLQGEANCAARLQLPAGSSFRVANALLSKELSLGKGKRKRESSCNHTYANELKTRIARYAAENGNARTVKRFSTQLGFTLLESTVRNFKKEYLAVMLLLLLLLASLMVILFFWALK